jgi:cell division ATPase FtsA
MSLSSLFGGNKEENVLLIDIGNGTISCALVVYSYGKVPKFIEAERGFFPVLEKPDPDRLGENMFSLLDGTLSSLFKKKKTGRTRHVAVSLTSPWFVLKTKHINISKENSFIITKTFLDSVVKEEERIFEDELKNDSMNSKDSFEIIEKSIVHTKINGYDIEESMGKKTKALDSFLCMSIANREVTDKINEIIRKHTHLGDDNISIHTFPLISFSVVRDIFGAVSDFILMDVTSEVTDLTLVRDNVMRKVASFPSGKNFLLRQIAKKLSVSAEIATSTLHLYNSQRLDKETSTIIDEILYEVEKEWSIYLENALSEFSENMALPESLYLTSDEDVSGIYSEFLKLSKTDSTSDFRKNLNLVYLNKKTLSNFYEAPVGLPDDFISILAVFYSKLFPKK